jgi:hypothetical protein
LLLFDGVPSLSYQVLELVDYGLTGAERVACLSTIPHTFSWIDACANLV